MPHATAFRLAPGRVVPVTSLLVCLLSAATLEAGVIAGSLSAERQFHVNLTAEGTEDWAVWGYADWGQSTSLAPDVRKAGGSAIQPLTAHSNGSPRRGLGQFGLYGQSSFDWSDADDLFAPTETGALTGLQHDGQQAPWANVVGEGFTLRVPADRFTRTLSLYVTAHYGVGRLTATLTDGAAPPYQADLNGSSLFNGPGVYRLLFQADSPGQWLDVRYVLASPNPALGTGNSSNVAIQAASLAVVPEPASLAWLPVAGLLLRRKRSPR
jgi:hypothetical protein